MNDLTRLRELRTVAPPPSPEAWANARSALEHAVLEERATGVPSPLRFRDRAAHRPGPRLVVSSVLAAAVVVLVAVLVVALGVGAPKGGHQESATGGRHGLVHPTWKLVSNLSSSWGVVSGVGLEPGVLLTCPAPGTCYASIQTEGPPGSYSLSYSQFEVTHDGGKTWQRSNLPVTLSAATPLSCVDAYTCATLGIDGSGGSEFFETTDGGESWVTVAGPSQLPSSLGPAVLSCTSASTCVAVVKGHKGSPGTAETFITSNAGATWAESPLPAGFFPGSLQCFSSGACVVVGLSETPQGNLGAILYSNDTGATWAPAAVPSGLGPAILLSCADSSGCLASSFDASSFDENRPASQMLASTDGGASWQLVAATGLPSGQVTGLSCPGTSDCWATGFAVSGDSVPRGFLASTADSGETWQQAQLPQGIDGSRDVQCPTSTACYALAVQRSVPSGSISLVLLAYVN
jgi:photosystem II stability/assembly factor-like uncharacterized protein